MDDKTPQENLNLRPEKNLTDDFKEQIQKATETVAQQVAFWKEFWKVWIPGGLRKRRRYRTQGHGKRKSIRRRKNKAARIARRANRHPKKKRRNK